MEQAEAMLTPGAAGQIEGAAAAEADAASEPVPRRTRRRRRQGDHPPDPNCSTRCWPLAARACRCALQGAGRDECRAIVGNHARSRQPLAAAGEVEDSQEEGEIFTRLMGDVVEPRRDFIQENALNVANLDVLMLEQAAGLIVDMAHARR
jgi:hypothetical protein